MEDVSEVEATISSLVDTVALLVDSSEETAQNVGMLPIGGYLWKFPSEGSNCFGTISKDNPPPAPQTREYPRKCDRCRVCWVSDHLYELDHLRRCSIADNNDIHGELKLKAVKLGVARRVWCEVDSSFSRLEWRHDRETDDISTTATNFVAFVDIAEVFVLDEPANSFQVSATNGRTLVFQWRPGNDGLETNSKLVPYRLELDAHQWQEYLVEISNWARMSPSDNLSPLLDSSSNKQNASVFDEISSLLLDEIRAESPGRGLQIRIKLVLEKYGLGLHLGTLLDKDGNSLVHAAINLNLGVQAAAIVSALLGMGFDCNLQNRDALHYAAACPTGLEALHFLCELLPERLIDVQCSEGNTALHVAAGCGCLDNVCALLETAANPHISNFNDESAYHLALRNNHIQCAVFINEYQNIPMSTYRTELLTAALGESTTATAIEQQLENGEGGEWLECFTEDGYAYYYNSVTGESSWYKPGEHQLPSVWRSVEYEEEASSVYEKLSVHENYQLSADVDGCSILGDGGGHQLPLCLIPMVSPLTSLDNPTAAAKYEATRRRARKERRRRQSRMNLDHSIS
ncbi:unnamed protein product [Phytophthora fragariaefolia]|uniref:Unnamed protein product n=1 Tax=Phytophthora fragariaefolia TaxID=1490495 RepID=A0A9W6YDU5_9STRA|nr:unnamed protein product [Phytophthora fragariaefolia]